MDIEQQYLKKAPCDTELIDSWHNRRGDPRGWVPRKKTRKGEGLPDGLLPGVRAALRADLRAE
jgi:hypothetical protein